MRDFVLLSTPHPKAGQGGQDNPFLKGLSVLSAGVDVQTLPDLRKGSRPGSPYQIARSPPLGSLVRAIAPSGRLAPPRRPPNIEIGGRIDTTRDFIGFIGLSSPPDDPSRVDLG
jgi:hypothetical protein